MTPYTCIPHTLLAALNAARVTETLGLPPRPREARSIFFLWWPDAPRDLPVIQKVHDLVLWFIPILNRFPVTHRHGIGERMIDGLYGLLEGLIRCRYSRDKLERLETLNAELNVLRHQVRLCL